jgi:endonuclease/exonuclease/phosphatase family metal-dependent hydrolase
MVIYKPSTFINKISKLFDLTLTYCPTIIMGDFNIDMYNQNSAQPNELKKFINYYSMELWFK